MARVIVVMVATLCAGVFVVPAHAAPALRFDSASYTVGPNQTFSVQVLLDWDSMAPGNQSPPGGLLSMGFKVSYDTSMAEVTDASWIVLPIELSTDGLGGAAAKSYGPGHAGAAGAVDFLATSGYSEPLIATVTIRNIATAPDNYVLSLGTYYQPGDNFVEYGEIQNFDSTINFDSANVEVVPEPTSLGLIAVGMVTLAGRRRSRNILRAGK